MTWFLIFPPIAILATAWAGGALTAKGVKTWYRTIKRPAWTPPGTVIGFIWTGIFMLAIASGVRYFSMAADPQMVWLSVLLFLLSCILNAAWSWLFFTRHRLRLAFWDAVLLDLSVLALMAVFWKVTPPSAWMLAPYAAWTAFASYLNRRIELMNR